MSNARVGSVVPLAASLLAAALFAPLALGSDPPDSRLNPQSGLIEVTDSTWTGQDFEIRHVARQLNGQLVVAVLTADPHDDLGPRLAISDVGSTRVAWWRAVAPGQVLSRARAGVSGQWSAETLVSDPAEDSRMPVIAHDGAVFWIAYLVLDGGCTHLAVTSSGDGPGPMPGRTLVGTTSNGGDVDLQISAEAAHVWMTWMETSAEVAWSRYDRTAGAWTPAAYEPAEDSVAAARERIRTTVLGN